LGVTASPNIALWCAFLHTPLDRVEV
jgi:hypothetical protein